MLGDLRIGARQLWKRKTNTAVAALCLAIGVGANVAIFTYIDAMYLRPIGVPNPGELARLFASGKQQAYGDLSYPEYLDIRRQCDALSGVAVAMRRGAQLVRDGRSELAGIYVVSPDFFPVMGVRAHRGRLFDRDELAVVIGYSAWQRHFGGDPGIVGRTVRLKRDVEVEVTIAGVLGPEFRDLYPGSDRDFWMPRQTFLAIGGSPRDFEDRERDWFAALARVRKGASIDQARAQLEILNRRLENDRKLIIESDLAYRLREFGVEGATVLAIVFLVLAIACMNVANLLVAGVEGRRHEMTVRAAVGATRSRLVRQLLIECALLGAVGLACAIPTAQWLMGVLPKLLSVDASRYGVQLDGRALVFTGAIALATVFLFGVAPSLVAGRMALNAGLKQSAVRGSSRYSLRNILVMVQIAASLVTLTSTVMLARSFWNRRHGDIGLAHKPVLVAWHSGLESSRMDRAALERVRAIPGVRKASVAFRAPLSFNGGGFSIGITIPGHPAFDRNTAPAVTRYNLVEPAYFSLLGIRLLRGRLFTDADSEQAPRVAIVSETMARRYWPNEDPLGKQFRSGSVPVQVVGVVADAPIAKIGENPEPYFYTSWWQDPSSEYTLLMETSVDAAGIRTALKEARIEVNSLTTMAELIEQRTAVYRGVAQLVAALGAAGLLLLAVGMYGVLAYTVALRRREIAIRLAIGAEPRQAANLVIAQGSRIVLIGLAAGTPLALGAAFALRTALYGVEPWDPVAFVAGAAALVVNGILASWLPARGASRVDPNVALQEV